MDEIEFRQTYDLAAASTAKIVDDSKQSLAYTKQAIALTLQLVNSLQEQIQEMQSYEDPDEC